MNLPEEPSRREASAQPAGSGPFRRDPEVLAETIRKVSDLHDKVSRTMAQILVSRARRDRHFATAATAAAVAYREYELPSEEIRQAIRARQTRADEHELLRLREVAVQERELRVEARAVDLAGQAGRLFRREHYLVTKYRDRAAQADERDRLADRRDRLAEERDRRTDQREIDVELLSPPQTQDSATM